MDTFPAQAYIPGQQPSRPTALDRYLPPPAKGIVARWLETNLPLKPSHSENLWVLDPFGVSPAVSVEAARAGYRVLVAANNPVARFLLEMTANLPDEDELRAALAELAIARKGEDRLEPHILSLYTTICDQCGKDVVAEAFVWEKGAEGEEPRLVGRIYKCPACNTEGEFPVLPVDIERATQFSAGGMHRARALERVSSSNDPDREHVEEALTAYLPRATYVLFTLINRLDGLVLSPIRRQHIQALLLSACDYGNTLWQYPTARPRPKQLIVPTRFRENNIWLALEQAILRWGRSPEDAPSGPLPLVIWPEEPPVEGGISLFEGRQKDLMADLGQIKIGAVVTTFPRPNQAFWTLSALWSGWLWGREAVGPFKSVLRRRRYDWGWHWLALHSALENLSTRLNPGTPFWGLITEVEPGFISAVLIAADIADYELVGLALRAESGQAQITLKSSTETVRRDSSAQTSQVDRSQDRMSSTRLVRQVARDYLMEKGEPVPYLQIHAKALTALGQAGLLKSLNVDSPVGGPTSQEITGLVNLIIEQALSDEAVFSRFAGSEKSLEVGYWWLAENAADPAKINSPQADRVEMALVNQLLKNPGSTSLEIDRVMCNAFPGLFTPSPELIHVCLESYGLQDPAESGRWRIREEDTPKTRHAELESMCELVIQIARRLGYQAEGQSPILWRDVTGEIQYSWYIQASAIIGKTVLGGEYPPEKSLVVLPGGRANLVAYKLKFDPRIRQLIEKGWRLIKFRQLRWLATSVALDPKTFDEQLTLDSITYNAPQMRLF